MNATPSQNRDFALVVGIDRYANSDFLEPLSGPKSDVERFLRWLTSPEGGSVPETNVTPYMLVSDDQCSKPKWSDVVALFGNLCGLSQGSEARIGRRLYIFFAGHGVGPDLDDAALLTVEANDDLPVYIEGRRYANIFRARALFEQVILIMDCCRDFDGDLPAPMFPFKYRIDAGGAHKVKWFYAYATGFGRAAREKTFGTEINGIFSHALIDGLEGAAVDGEGCITGSSLERYVRKQMKIHLPVGVEQNPDIRFFPPDFMFADGFAPAMANVEIEATVPHDKLVVLYGHGFKPVETLPRELGGAKFQIALRVGKTYVFRLFNGEVMVKEDGYAIDDTAEVVRVKL